MPTRILVAPWGVNETNKGPVIVNETTLASLAVNNREMKFDRVALHSNQTTPRLAHSGPFPNISRGTACFRKIFGNILRLLLLGLVYE